MLKHILITIIFLAVLFATCWFVKSGWGLKKPENNIEHKLAYLEGYAAGYAAIKSISELQEQAGMEPDDCDGVWDAKTKAAYNLAYNNQEYKLLCERMSK